METYRLILIIIIMSLCIADLVLTAYYIYKYKSWQPNKPYKLIELNPLLVFLWEKMGFWIGMFIGAVIILSLNFIVSKYAHWLVVLLLLGFLIFTIFNHIKNFTLLEQLMKLYPSGYLPSAIFGVVIGNNQYTKRRKNETKEKGNNKEKI